ELLFNPPRSPHLIPLLHIYHHTITYYYIISLVRISPSNMSLTSCFLVFLLCLSLHACTARRPGAVHIENNMPQYKLHTSTKVEVDGVKFKTGEKEKDRTGPRAIQTNNKHGVSVSWKVPHRKHGEKLSGFINLDYSPPKTHPPSHN
ncbi:hypothetical protein Godav_006209, partial [Gossypium davidsonii]|nr:hypothetical protein [Gossypium davidsonii]